MELENKIYILVEDKRRVIVVSDSYSLCEYFRKQLIQMFGAKRELDIYHVDKDRVMLGCSFSFDMYYRNIGGTYGT